VVEFQITDLDVHVPSGLPIMWRGYKISTGPLDFGLGDSTGISCGVMNYELGVVSSEFHVLVRFRRFALQLKALGIDAELMAPIHAVLKTEGKILPDHSFNGGPAAVARSSHTRCSLLRIFESRFCRGFDYPLRAPGRGPESVRSSKAARQFPGGSTAIRRVC